MRFDAKYNSVNDSFPTDLESSWDDDVILHGINRWIKCPAYSSAISQLLNRKIDKRHFSLYRKKQNRNWKNKIKYIMSCYEYSIILYILYLLTHK